MKNYLVAGSSPQPFWIGEFGTCNTASTCVSSSSNANLGYWFGFIHQFLSQYSVDWSYWAFNGTTEDGNGNGFGSAETYGIMNTSWNGDALPALTSNLQSLMDRAKLQSQMESSGGQARILTLLYCWHFGLGPTVITAILIECLEAPGSP